MFSYGNHVATGSWDRTLILWCVETGMCVHQYVGHNEGTSFHLEINLNQNRTEFV